MNPRAGLQERSARRHDQRAPGVTIVVAHRDTHFRFLQHVRVGDVVEAESLDGARHRYRVTRTEITRGDRFAVAPGGAINELALATCYPFGGVAHGPLRFVVWAAPSPR
jgi:sortase A